MRKLMQTLMAVCLLTVSLAAFAQSGSDIRQDNMQPDQTKPDQMKANDTNKDGLGCPWGCGSFSSQPRCPGVLKAHLKR